MATFSQSPEHQAQVIVAVPDDSHDRAEHLKSKWGMEDVMANVYRCMVHAGLTPLRRFIGYCGREQWMYALAQSGAADALLGQLENDLARQPVVLFAQAVNDTVRKILNELQMPPHLVEES